MKKLLFICLFLILIVPTVSANDFNPQSIGYMEAEIKISSKITSDQLIDEINQSIYAVPENYYYFDVLGPDKYQIVEDENNKKLNLQWNNFKQGEYEIIAKIRNNADMNKRFPTSDLIFNCISHPIPITTTCIYF